MTYPEQLKQMTNEELLDELYIITHPHFKAIKTELLSRMEQPSQEHLKEALEEIANYPHAYDSQIDIQEIAKEALNQK